MSIISIEGNDIDYDEDLFAIYLTLSPELDSGFRYWTDGIFLSHDGRTYTESTASDSMAVGDDSIDELEIALLDYAEAKKVRKCKPGNKPCGNRCISNSWKCRLDEVTGKPKAEKKNFGDYAKTAATIAAVGGVIALGVTVYVKREEIMEYVEKATHTAAIEVFKEVSESIATDTDYEGMKDTPPIKGEDVSRGIKRAAEKILRGKATDERFADVVRDYADDPEFARFADNLMRNDVVRGAAKNVLDRVIRLQPPETTGQTSSNGFDMLAGDLINKENAAGIGSHIKRGVRNKVKSSKLWQFLTRPITPKNPFRNFAEEEDNETDLDLISLVYRVGVIMQDMENAAKITTNLIINDLMEDDPLTGYALLSGVVALFAEDLAESDE